MRFNLAYAEGFEALTMTAIKHMMEPDGFGEDLSPIMQMWEWHFVEELEHCTAAFDVYDHVCGGYFYRLAVGLWAQWHFTSWIRRVEGYMLKMRPPPKRSAEELAERKKLQREARSDTIRNLLPKVLPIYLPSYTPHALAGFISLVTRSESNSVTLRIATFLRRLQEETEDESEVHLSGDCESYRSRPTIGQTEVGYKRQ